MGKILYCTIYLILALMLYIVGHSVSDEKAKDPFFWGTLIGGAMFTLIFIAVNIIMT